MEEIVETVKKEGIILPTEITKATTKNIRSLCIYGLPKSGKTTAVSKLKNALIIDLEDGSAFIDGIIIKPDPKLGPVGIFNWLKDIAKAITIAGKPYDYVVIDTLSELDTLAEWVGTYNYMNSPQGKTFNRDKKGQVFHPDSPDYESVLTLGQGYGYRYTRDAILDIFQTLKPLGKICTIFICHVTDKAIVKTVGEEVYIKDLALVGKTSTIIPRLVDAVAMIYNEEGKSMISFVGSEQKVGGIRATHLLGYQGILDWNKIFIQ